MLNIIFGKTDKDGYLAYSKRKLNRNYLNDSVEDKIIQTIRIFTENLV